MGKTMFCGKVRIISNNRVNGPARLDAVRARPARLDAVRARPARQCPSGGHYFKIRLNAKEIARPALPGQFVEVRVLDSYEPLWRRPFSIHRVIKGNMEILYEVVGKGTQILSQKKPGEYLDVIGPLGNGFELRREKGEGRKEIIVAGGMGVAPLVFLAEELVKNIRPSPLTPRSSVLIGARTRSQVSCEKEFKNLGYDVKIATDDGSYGFKGKVTELLEKYLRRTKDEGQRMIYGCGPKHMLKEVARISIEYKIPAQISLEEYMACGFGACLGCAVKSKNGYKRVCKEGPVFEAREIIWE